MTNVDLELVAEGVHRVADGLVNWYLVEEDGQLTLVDAGWPSSRSRVDAAVEAAGRSLADVTAILLTHGHPDHLGAAEHARQATGAQVLAHRDEVARVRGESSNASPIKMVPSLAPQLRRPAALRFVAQATVRGFLTPRWVKQVRAFDSGEELDVPGRPRVVPTPGHTEGHVSFLFEGRGVVIVGDELVTRDPITGAPGPRIPHDAVNADPPSSRRSLDRLAELEADTLLSGHGDPWRGGMADAVARAREADSP